MTLPGVKAVLLDIDGTLLDSNTQQAKSWFDALEEAGVTVDYDAVRLRIGKGGDKMAIELAGLAAGHPAVDALGRRASNIFLTRYLDEVRPTNGTRALLARMKASGLRLVVATSAGDEMLEALLKQAGVEDLIDTSATSSDVSRSKPDPDIIHQALAKAGVAAHEAVMLGDTPYDIEAAKSAGVPCVVLRCGGRWSDGELAGATAIYDDPTHMLATIGHLLTPLKLHSVS
jgi:HAD superfamily hydrolase (TIGR01509 family)